MTIHYRTKNDREDKWKFLSDDIDLKEFSLNLLRKEAYKDNDGGYQFYIEFDIDGVRKFSYGIYNGWNDDEDDGALSYYDLLVDLDEAKQELGYIEKSRCSPGEKINKHITVYTRTYEGFTEYATYEYGRFDVYKSWYDIDTYVKKMSNEYIKNGYTVTVDDY